MKLTAIHHQLWDYLTGLMLVGFAMLLSVSTPTFAVAADPLDLIDLVPEDVGVIVEVNNFSGLLTDLEESGLWEKIKVFPVVHQWLSGERFTPLARLRRVVERETGQPVRKLLGELASERFLIVARPATSGTSDSPIEAAMILRPANEGSIEMLLLLHNSSQRTQPLFGFLKEYVVIATDQEILDEITLKLETHQRGVKQETPRVISWSKSTFDLPNVRVLVDLDTWAGGEGRQLDELSELFLKSFKQVEMIATLESGLTVLMSLHRSNQENVQALLMSDLHPTVTSPSPTTMLTVRGVTNPAGLISLVDRMVEENDRKEWESFANLGKMLWGEDSNELMSAMRHPWKWSLAVTLTASSTDVGPQNVLDATWTVLLPELSPKLKRRIDRVASSTVNMAAIAAFTERQLTPQVRLIVQDGTTKVSGMWLESILGMTPGYAMTDRSFTVATLMSQFDVTKVDTTEPTHDFEIVFRPKLVKDFLDSRSDSVKAGSRIKEEVMRSREYQILVSLLDIFHDIELTADDEPTRVRMVLSGRVEQAASETE